MANTGDRIERKYGGFRGVDFRGEEINILRSPDSLNVWKDYKETESIRTRPGMALVQSFDAPVYGVFFYQVGEAEVCFVHSGTYLWAVRDGLKTMILSMLNERESNGFVYNNMWYFHDGKTYWQIDLRSNGFTASKVTGYVPTTSIARKPAGGGTIHEDINLLNGQRINTFLADGTSTDFYLDAQDIDTGYAPIVRVNGVVKTNYTVDYTAGKIAFKAAPTAPLTDGQDNVSVQFRKTVEGYADRIHKCTLLQVFDNRVFFSGNPDFPNVIWHSSLDDPTYCSDLDYYTEGLDSAPIKSLVAGNNALWVFREPSQSNTSVFYHTPTIDAEYGKIYPNTHSNISTGCIGKAINFNDDIVFFSDRGMEGVNGDITTEQAVQHRSTLVDRKLIAETDYRDMILAEWEGYLVVIIGNKAYLADSRAMFTNENHYEYEWFYWELEKKITCASVHNGVLYLGTEDGVYSLTDMEKDLESYWVTPKDRFNAPQKLKTTNKRGCVAEATGDISLYAKLEDTDFEHIGTYNDITDYFVCRIKRKKFKDIQLKFYSNTRFSLEQATLECFIGGYIKR